MFVLQSLERPTKRVRKEVIYYRKIADVLRDHGKNAGIEH